MDELDFTKPEDVLRAFMIEMHQWERESYLLQRNAVTSPEAQIHNAQQVLAWMNQIFQRYCTPKPRPYGRQGTYTHPPEYDPEQEPILEIIYKSRSRVHILSQQQRGFGNKCQYVLIKRHNRWLIDNRRIIFSDGSSITNTL